VGKGALAPCPPFHDVLGKVGTLRFAHPTRFADAVFKQPRTPLVITRSRIKIIDFPNFKNR
jgi:hypothetical protein